MELVRAHLTDILQPFAENVEELHKNVFSMSDSIRELRARVDAHDPLLAKQGEVLSGVRTDLTVFADKFNAMRDSLQSTDVEIKAEAAELQATATKLQAISKQTLDKLDAVNALTQNSLNKLQSGVDHNCTDIERLIKAEADMRITFSGSKEKMDKLATGLHDLHKDHTDAVKQVEGNGNAFEEHVNKTELLQQEQKEDRMRFQAYVEENSVIHNNFREQFGELDNKIVCNQKNIVLHREESDNKHNEAVSMLKDRLTRHDVNFEKATESFAQMETRTGSLQDLIVQNGENTSKQIKIGDQKRIDDIEALRKQVDERATDASRHTRQITDLQEIVHPRGGGKSNVEALLGDMLLSMRRHVRLEQMFGLEPITEDSQDCDEGLTLKSGITLTKAQTDDFSKKFKEFDVDGSGSVSVAEVHRLLQSMGHDIDLEVVTFIVKDIDADNSGAVVFEEFCSFMSKILGPDGEVDKDGYLSQATEMSKREAKHNQMAELLPVLKKDVEQHACLIQVEQSKLSSTSDRVNTLKGDHEALTLEVERLRANLNANNANWSGLSQGLQETKRTVRGDGDGGMLPNVKNLRNLPPLDARPNAGSSSPSK